MVPFGIVRFSGVSGVNVVCGAGGSTTGVFPRVCTPATTDAADTGATRGAGIKLRLCGAAAMLANVCDPVSLMSETTPLDPPDNGGLILPSETARGASTG